MKTILIITSDHFSIRNFLYSPFINNDFKKENIKIVFVLRKPDNHLANVSNKNNIVLENLFSKDNNFRNKLSNKFINFLYQTLVYRFYKINNFSNLKIKEDIPKKFLINKREDKFNFTTKFPCPGSKLLFSIFKKLYNSLLFPGKRAEELFNSYKPDLLVLTNPQTPISREYIIAAKKRKIKAISHVTSWDFLTTKGPIYSYVSRFVVWNRQMKNELIKIHQFKGKIDSIGPLQMDYTFQKNVLWNKQKTCDFFNISSNKKIIVFGVYNKRFGAHEPSIVKYLIKKVLKKQNSHLILRGHPHDISFRERYGFALNSGLVTLNQGYRFDLHGQDKNDDRQILNSMLKNADVVMCGPTTLTLDALRFEKPVINIAFDGDLEIPPVASIKKRYLTEHYSPLLSYNGLYFVESFKEMETAIIKSLKNPRDLEAGIKKIKNDYLEPLDGKASDRLFKLIINEMRQITCDSI